MPERTLTPTSYLVLGLVRTLQPCTSYEMKQLVKGSLGMLWSFPHSQIYAEPARLVEDGLLTEDREEGGRRRRLFRLTPSGWVVLRDWINDVADDHLGELRDDGLLRLFFSSGLGHQELRALAERRRDAHRDRIASLQSLRERLPQATPAQLATFELGVRWDRTAAEFWSEVAERPPV